MILAKDFIVIASNTVDLFNGNVGLHAGLDLSDIRAARDLMHGLEQPQVGTHPPGSRSD